MTVKRNYFEGCCTAVSASTEPPEYWRARLVSNGALANAYVLSDAIENTAPDRTYLYDVIGSRCLYVDFNTRSSSPGTVLNDWIVLDDESLPMMCSSTSPTVSIPSDPSDGLIYNSFAGLQVGFTTAGWSPVGGRARVSIIDVSFHPGVKQFVADVYAVSGDVVLGDPAWWGAEGGVGTGEYRNLNGHEVTAVVDLLGNTTVVATTSVDFFINQPDADLAILQPTDGDVLAIGSHVRVRVSSHDWDARFGPIVVWATPAAGGSPSWTKSFNATSVDDSTWAPAPGEYTVHAKLAHGGPSGPSNHVTGGLTVLVGDASTPPTITKVTPASLTVRKNPDGSTVDVDLHFTTDVTCDEITISDPDGELTSAQGTTVETVLDVTSVPDGDMVITVDAYRDVGHTVHTQGTYTLSIQPSVVSIASPAEGDVIQTGVETGVTFNESDWVFDTATVYFTDAASNVTQFDNSLSSSGMAVLTVPKDAAAGACSFILTLKESGSDVVSSSRVHVTLQPAVFADSVSTPQFFSQSGNAVVFDSNVTGVDHYQLQFYTTGSPDDAAGATYSGAVSPLTAAELPIPPGSLPVGSLTLKVRVVGGPHDGLVSDSVTLEVQDDPPPTVTVDSISDNPLSSSGSGTLTFSAGTNTGAGDYAIEYSTDAGSTWTSLFESYGSGGDVSGSSIPMNGPDFPGTGSYLVRVVIVGGAWDGTASAGVSLAVV